VNRLQRSLLAVVAAFVVSVGFAPLPALARDARIQSAARPFDLDIVAPVQRRRSDTASTSFYRNELPIFSSLMGTDLNQQVSTDSIATTLLDPANLVMQSDYNARAYFVGEDAGYHNTLGFNTQGTGISSGNPQLIFPDVSEGRRRSYTNPVKSGDFVELGNLSAGTKLDFFLIADGARGGRSVFSTNASTNPDSMRHIFAHAFTQPNSPYLMLAFEDMLGGGDQDYNDLLIAVDVGADNLNKMIKTVGAPEPSMLITMGTLVSIGVAYTRRKRKQRNEIDDIE
jgi:hypothetical protein